MMCRSTWTPLWRTLALHLCGLLVLAGSTAIAEDEIENALVNGDFDQDVANWGIEPMALQQAAGLLALLGLARRRAARRARP
jgi:hypothetical protein